MNGKNSYPFLWMWWFFLWLRESGFKGLLGVDVDKIA